MDKDILQMVAFAILMEGGISGILGKSPNYIREKFNLCMGESGTNRLTGLLDADNQAILRLWKDRWIPKIR